MPFGHALANTMQGGSKREHSMIVLRLLAIVLLQIGNPRLNTMMIACV
jgi:hypothetical protein